MHPLLTTTFQQDFKNIILRTAEFMRTEFARFDTASIERKGRNDLVSFVDKQAEAMLTDGLSALIPGSGFIREEGGELNASSEWRWIIDPLDGTTNFVHGVPIYCISVGLQYQEQTIFGVVHDVERNEYFHAIRGGGAFANDVQLHISSTSDIGQSLIATGFPYSLNAIMDDYLAVLRAFLAECHGIRRLGSAAIDLAWVAAGRFDGFYETRLNPWDVAAGALLVEEAGGTVSDFTGGENFLFGRQIVASNARIHRAMLDVLARTPGTVRLSS